MVFSYIPHGIAALLIVSGLPMALKLIPYNRHFGYRTELALSSEPLWYSMNQMAGILFIIGGCLSLAAIWLLAHLHASGTLSWSEQTRQLIAVLVPAGFSIIAIAITQIAGEQMVGQ